MSVTIFIKRTVTVSLTTELTTLLNRMRSVTLMQPGYVSGQTVKRIDIPGEYLVISKWRSLEDWENWFNSAEREEIQMEIDSLLGEETTYAIYH